MKADKKAVLYLRVSTEDKNQNPERQRSDLLAWCQGEGVEAVGVVVDEGTSATKTNPFERPRFLDAMQIAQEHGAAILVLTHDRFTRQGSDEAAWARVEMKRQTPPVALWVASKGGVEDQDREVVAALIDTVNAETDRKWAKDHGRSVASGMRQAKMEGRHIGRPRKVLSADELRLAMELHAAKKGVRHIASVINGRRGLYRRADVAAALRKHGVSKSLVHDYLTGKRAVDE